MKKILLVIALLAAVSCFAEDKVFIREYTYQASESDSKISARNQALDVVKKMLLEELGVYVESYVNYTIESQGNQITKDFLTNEIKLRSAGITETKILEERWNGEQYYVRAEVTADPTDVVRKINQTLEKRRSDVVIDSLHILVANMTQNVEAKSAEIDSLSQKLNIQTAVNLEQKQIVDELNNQLSSLQNQLNQYREDEKRIKSEIDRIKTDLESRTNTAVANARIGMSTKDIRSLCGEPSKKEIFMEYTWYNYGYLWLGFQNDILLVSVPIEDYHGGLITSLDKSKSKLAR